MNIALVLSGGRGIRLGSDIPKQYLEAGGRPVISYCVETLSAHGEIDAIQIVAEPIWQERISAWLEKADRNKKFQGFSLPGENRQLSILRGLEDIREYGADTDYVLVHDAARPFLTAKLISECLSAGKGHDGVLPALPMKDTVYVSEDGRKVSSLLRRSSVFAGQAPELFQLGKYYEANRRLLPERILGINGSTEPAVLAGMDIVMIPGDEGNFKITTKADLERFREIVSLPAGKGMPRERRVNEEERQGRADRGVER